MKHEDFRSLGHQIIDWIADYMERGHDGPVYPSVQPGELLKALPEMAPEDAETPQALMDDFVNLILPATTHWNDPRFFAYFPCNHSGPAILGDLLSSGLGVNAMSWATSPAATELEIMMMRWLGKLIGLPWPGTIQDTASTGTLCALLAAREKAADVNSAGYAAAPRLIAYTSEQAHSSVIKAVRIAGVGDENLRMIACDRQQAMDPEALAQAMEMDRQMGRIPFFVTATVGTTSTTAVDPVPALAEVCERFGAWLHVDAALAGSAAILPEMRWLMDGVDLADSFLFNPHKWLFTNFDCSAFFCKTPLALKRALAIQPEYLKTDHDEAAENFRDWGIQLGRRFRALKLWFVLRGFGVSRLQAKIRLHLQMAQWFAGTVEAHPRLHLFGAPLLNTVCFSRDDDESTRSLMARINGSGRAFVSHTVVENRFLIRASFGQTHATMDHAHQLMGLIEELIEAA